MQTTPESRSDRQRVPALRWVAAHRQLSVCAVAVGLVVVVAAAAPWIAPYDPYLLDATDTLQSPSSAHWLGTDHLGRDVFSRLIFGARTALLGAAEAVLVALTLGVTLGLLIGYFGGWADRIGMRLADMLQAIPALLLAMAVIAAVGNGVVKAMFAVGLVFVDSVTRITRATVLAEREKLYVDAARVGGLRRAQIVFRQILPNIAGQLVVYASVLFGVALLIGGMLSFLGVGSRPDEVRWGEMLAAAHGYELVQPFLPVFPGLALTACVLLFNLLGDALRDVVHGDNGAGRWHPTTPASTGTAAVPTELVSEPSEPALLQVRDLTVSVPSGDHGTIELVSSVGFDVRRGEIYGLVGESGCGKSLTAAALVNLLRPPVFVQRGSVRLGNAELVGMRAADIRAVRGARIGMVFQDPVSTLSPVHTIGQQMVDVVRARERVSAKEARERSAEFLGMVGVPDPRRRLDDYPHQFSGGMAQRVGIASALLGEPELLVADEPTTALDVTVQIQVLDLISDLRDRLGMSVLLITHDMGVIAGCCDRASVMYAGQIVEQGDLDDLFFHPRHPYTEALLAAIPGESAGERLATIPGNVPPAWAWPGGCRFHPRCGYSVSECQAQIPPLSGGVRCLRASELTLEGTRE